MDTKRKFHEYIYKINSTNKLVLYDATNHICFVDGDYIHFSSDEEFHHWKETSFSENSLIHYASFKE